MCDHEGGNCGGPDRREFRAGVGVTFGAMALGGLDPRALGAPAPRRAKKKGATIRVAFLYPPSKTFSGDPDGWWSWPGNEFDAEGRHRQYAAALREMEHKHGLTLQLEREPIGTAEEAQRFARGLEEKPADGVLLVMFYNNSVAHADRILEVAEAKELPAIFYVGLGVKHGPITKYRRPGIYFIQALDDLSAIEWGLRMVQTRKIAAQSRLLSITEAPEPREGVEKFLGTTVRVIPFDHYAAEFEKVTIDDRARKFIAQITRGAREQRGITPRALENAARAHGALKKLLTDHEADGLTMNCLRRGMLKPCMSFSVLNGELVPAACENDFPAMYTQMLGQLLTGRPGFQHNPAYETERNHYYASHCTCATKLTGPDGPSSSFLLRRFAHTNEGSCAVQVFWEPGDPVTMVRYHPGESPALDVYAGRVTSSHPMPPVGGCTTNVEIELTDRRDACLVQGHHNLLFVGDFAARFRHFANLHGMQLLDTGYEGPWPG